MSERTLSGTYYYLFDGPGSSVALTDSTGAVTNIYAYDPYGTVTSSSGSVTNPYRFGGAYGAYTDSSGLLKIGQRYYDSSLGRWIQQDLPGSPAMLEAPFPDPGSVYGYTDRNCPLQSAFPDC
ncbi:RHS repeat-associated core domain-containing protein [Nitrolancea hollandica]|uniref:Teneurin-like YD-shell domain-containing protein n=1 Tax=Nitrolancea hollandica Lb TaxID=1129897 RepID=I4ELI6_9BACT|nr:RHS repeat-associated core domain-containing protein [Nitrolancea hollandica]CCF85548.1 hypothetical protein NITHO_5130009 [Nitrolancea hollandica Lb]